LVQFHEQFGELLRLEGGAAEVASRPERTVVTIPFAGRGEQGLEQQNLFSVGELGRVDEGSVFFFRCEAGGFGGLDTSRVSRDYSTSGRSCFLRMFQFHLPGEQFERADGVHAL
jgi:hypothetical protein